MKTLEANPYNATIYLFRKMSAKQFKKAIRRHKVIAPCAYEACDELDDSGRVNGRTWFFGGHIIVWTKTNDIPVLVHELLHVCVYVLEEAGVVISHGNDEPLAYLQSFLLSKALGRK